MTSTREDCGRATDFFAHFDDGRGRPGHIRAETTFLPLMTLSVQTLMTSIYDIIKGVTVGPQ